MTKRGAEGTQRKLPYPLRLTIRRPTELRALDGLPSAISAGLTWHPSLRGNYLRDMMPPLRPSGRIVMSPMFSFIVGLSPYLSLPIDGVLV